MNDNNEKDMGSKQNMQNMQMKHQNQQQQHKPGGGGVFGNFIMNQLSQGMNSSVSSNWTQPQNNSNGWYQQQLAWNSQPGWNQQQSQNNGWPQQPQQPQQPNQAGFGGNFIMNQLHQGMNNSGHNNNNGWGQQ